MQVRLKHPVAKVVRKLARLHGVPIGEFFRRLLEPTDAATLLRKVIAEAAYQDGPLLTCFDAFEPEINPPGMRARPRSVNSQQQKRAKEQ